MITIKEIAELTGAAITGDPEYEISGVAKIEEANAGDLTFLYLPQYQKYFSSTRASAIFVKPGFEKIRNDIIYLEVADPNKAFLKVIIKYFSPEFPLAGIDSSAYIAPTASVAKSAAIGKNVVISEGCKIGERTKIFHNTVLSPNVEIGDDCLIFQNVSIRENCRIGNRVILHPGVVIGSDGFGFLPDNTGSYIKIPQIGNVVIEDDVEIGANTAIDRAALGSTIIRRGVKLDNLIQIAHGVSIGSDTVISAQSGISGSTKIGSNCIIAGQVGTVGHIEITDKVIIGAQSGISKSITAPGTYFGYPAKEHKEALRIEGHIRNLAEYAKRIKELEKKVEELTSNKKERS